MGFTIDRKQTVAKNLEAAVAFIADLEGKAEIAAGELLAVSNDLKAVTGERDSLMGKVNEMTTAATKTAADLATAQAAVTDFDAKVLAKVTDELAKQGIPPLGKGKDEAKPTTEALWEQYRALAPIARPAFYNAHPELHPK